MNIINNSTVEYFLNRFYNCYDSILRHIKLTKDNKTNISRAQVTLSIRDNEKDIDDEWVNLIIIVENIIEFICDNPKKYTDEVLSDGIKIGFYRGLVYLDFEPYTDEPEGVEDFLKSKCLIISRMVYWETIPYSETA